MTAADWEIAVHTADRSEAAACGNRFLTGNGYLGYRGTLEEDGPEELVAVNLAGLYDGVPGKWRETVNAPNPLYAALMGGGETPLSARDGCVSHTQSLCFRNGLHQRRTVFRLPKGCVEVESRRFAHRAQKHALAMRYAVRADTEMELRLRFGVDGRVWDINGPHLTGWEFTEREGVLLALAHTQEHGRPVAVAQAAAWHFPACVRLVATERGIFRELAFSAEPGKEYAVEIFANVRHSQQDCRKNAFLGAARLAAEGYAAAFSTHTAAWDSFWADSDVEIDGDEAAQTALRYSIYQLGVLEPDRDACSVAARGVSGQTYKGAVFWDSEIFLLPFFLATNEEAAKRLVRYRVATLEGARRKAKEYGYTGAFYAWESQDTGDDACSDYNVTDAVTGKPVRTYFREEQIHISGDVAYGIWQAYRSTGDFTLLERGGAEVILSCAQFYRSRAVACREEEGRYSLPSVVGPDEYHERVDDNAFTNRIALFTLRLANEVLSLFDASRRQALLHDSGCDIAGCAEVARGLVQQRPDTRDVIEQFSGYFNLEDVSTEEVASRLAGPNEYWGKAAGSTQVIKQADVVTMLALFKEDYPEWVLRANWEYYEPRTEHGSSLSNSMYALVAAAVGRPDRAYPFFLRSATEDIRGESKQYAGGIYIGGTHPAAAGGAWQAAVYGFAGLHLGKDGPIVSPRLPPGWRGMRFRVRQGGARYRVEIGENSNRVERI